MMILTVFLRRKCIGKGDLWEGEGKQRDIRNMLQIYFNKQGFFGILHVIDIATGLLESKFQRYSGIDVFVIQSFGS